MRATTRLTTPIATVSAGLLAAWVVALSISLRVSLDNHYLSYGFFRTFVFLLQGALPSALPAALGAALAIALLTVRRARRDARVASYALRLVAVAAGLGFFLKRGYVYNRFELGSAWHRLQAVGPVRLPAAVFQWEMWRANLLITLGALLVGVGVGVILHLALGRRPAAARRLWEQLGHPLGLAVSLLWFAATPALAGLLRSHVVTLPNIILVSLDTLRADRVGVYGCERPTTPELDRLAGEGILFERAIAQAPNTPPSHMSIFTSLYPTIHGFLGSDDRLPGWRLTLTEYLRDAGYRTLATTDGGFMRGRFGFNQGFEHYDDRDKGIAQSVPLIFDWIDGGGGRPRFFVFLHCYDIHSPYDPPAPYRDMFTDPGYTGGFYPGSRELEAIRQAVNQDPAAGHGLSPADIAFIKARYDGGVRYADHWIGQLTEGLRARGLLANTWLIVTSDHGEEFTEHGSVLHEKLYHTVTHVPLILRPPDDPQLAGPAGTRRGTRVPAVVELIDLMPTLLELTDRRAAGEMQGASLVGMLQGEARAWKDRAYSEHPWFGMHRAITTPAVHIIASLDGKTLEAYDYGNDPLEQAPLAGDAWAGEMPGLVRELLDWSAAQLLAVAGQERSGHPVVLDEETLRQLRALGYID